MHAPSKIWAFAVVLIGWIPVTELAAATYYLDSKTGDDARDGTAAQAAWRSIERANRETFQPGDRVLLSAGSKWEGVTFQPHGSGRDGSPITIDRYGEGAKPAIHGHGRVDVCLRLENQSYWEIQNLEITNQSDSGPRDLRGVEIRACDIGWIRHIYLRGLDIHGINAVSDYTTDGSTQRKSFGGLFTIISGSGKQTAWDDLRIEDCAIHDVGPIGMAMLSSWMSGHRDNDQKTWFPSRNVVIRGNRFEHTARNGLIVRGCVKPLIERNLFKDCAYGGSGNASFSFHCDDAMFQFNESCFTRYNKGDTDATGFDSDYCCRRSVFQYNYSHDNEYGFMVVCSQPPNGFNDGTIVRYNISQNDGGNVFRFSGNITNTDVYNNTIFAGSKMTNPVKGAPPRIIYNKSWNHGWSDKLNFHDNIFINLSKKARYTEGKSTENEYSHNLFFGIHPLTEPNDATKLLVDPLLVKPGGASFGMPSAVVSYSPRAGAPKVGAGAGFRLEAEKNSIVETSK
jgi:hypothetical protein